MVIESAITASYSASNILLFVHFLLLTPDQLTTLSVFAFFSHLYSSPNVEQLMIEVKKEGVLLHKTNLDFECEGVLNPAVINNGDGIHIFNRAVGAGNYSSIGHCKLSGPLSIEERQGMPILSPEFGYESHGIEDPRISKIDDHYYLTYTAYDGVNALGALAVSKDLRHFQKLGLIVPKISFAEFNELAASRAANYFGTCSRTFTQ